MSWLSKVFASRKVKSALGLLKKALGSIGKDALIYVAEAAAKPDLDNKAKFEYVKAKLIKKYGKLSGWNFAIEWAVAQFKGDGLGGLLDLLN